MTERTGLGKVGAAAHAEQMLIRRQLRWLGVPLRGIPAARFHSCSIHGSDAVAARRKWVAANTEVGVGPPTQLLPSRATDRALALLALAGAWTADGIGARWSAAWPAVKSWQPLLDALLAEYPATSAARVSAEALAAWMRSHRDQQWLPAAEPLRAPHLPYLLAPPAKPERWLIESAPAPMPRLDFRPKVLSLPALAEHLGLSLGELDWLRARCRGHCHYRLRLIPRPSGGVRILEIPKQRLKQVQRAILRDLSPAGACSDQAHGFVPGRSALSHARLHCARGSLLQLDLRDWFAGIVLPRVRAVFIDLGYPMPVANELAQLCPARLDASSLAALPSALRIRARDRHLPQGAPTSPALANLCARGLDRRLAAYAAAAGWRYSRYADDLVFSSEATCTDDFRRALPSIERIVRDEGFAPNPSKTRIQSQGQRQRVTGIVTNARPALAREDFDRLKAEVHAWCRGRERVVDGEDRGLSLQRLLGRIGWLRQLQAARGDRLLARLRVAGIIQ